MKKKNIKENEKFVRKYEKLSKKINLSMTFR